MQQLLKKQINSTTNPQKPSKLNWTLSATYLHFKVIDTFFNDLKCQVPKPTTLSNHTGGFLAKGSEAGTVLRLKTPPQNIWTVIMAVSSVSTLHT